MVVVFKGMDVGRQLELGHRMELSGLNIGCFLGEAKRDTGKLSFSPMR